MGAPRHRAVLAGVVAASLLAVPAVAQAADRNDDGIPDRWERRHGLPLSKDQSRRDQDDDGLRNLFEFRARMDPRDGDSDDDGVEDGDEGAGTVDSFDADTGRLRIDLFGGDSISGLVTDRTWIECDRQDEPPKEPDPPKEPEPEPAPPKEPERGDELRPADEAPVQPEEDVPVKPGVGEEETDKPEPDEEDDGKQCSVDDLVPGTVVQEAQLYLSGGQAVWKDLELRK